MGIVNVTPDSFSDGGDFAQSDMAVQHGRRLLDEGARIIDVGGESTRPGSDEVADEDEISRVVPVVRELAALGVPVSIDTRHAHVALACVESGASIINDVSGFRDPAMVEIASSCDVGVVIMHMLGEPKTMQSRPYYEDVVSEVAAYLAAQARVLEDAGIARERIAIDPGLGFGKTTEHNLELIKGIPVLAAMGYPVLIGASRKRFIGEITGAESPKDRIFGSLMVAAESASRGASVLRVHDVAATVAALAIQDALASRLTGE